jgi:hypothetical protein
MDLKCFDKVIVRKPIVEQDSITAIYELETGRKNVHTALRAKYESNIIGPDTQMFANMIATVPAINEGLFADEIVLEYDLTPAQYHYFSLMLDWTSREIFMHELYEKPFYVKPEFLPKDDDMTLDNVRSKAKLISGIDSRKTVQSATMDDRVALLSSGGKDSLASYGVLREAGIETYPIFMNESGGHWRTALPAYEYFKKNEPNTMRVWHNLDHMLLFLVRNMRILDQDIIEKRSRNRGASAIADPINLFSFAHYQFSALPLLAKHGIGNLCMGNEYDDSRGMLKGDFTVNGIRYYSDVFDQSNDYESHTNHLLKQDGIGVRAWSPIRPITGFLVQKMLAERYQDLFKLQRSCHHVSRHDGDSHPCGTCKKCKRIMSYVTGIGKDPLDINYTDKQIGQLQHILDINKLTDDETMHAHSLLAAKGYRANTGDHDHVEKLHFDRDGVHPGYIPSRFREKIYRILLDAGTGVVKMDDRLDWQDTTLDNVLKSGQ